MRWTKLIAAAAAAVLSSTGHAGLALPDLEAESGNSYSSYGFDLYNDQLYIATGDSIYRVNTTAATPQLEQVVTDLRSYFYDPEEGERKFDGGLAINHAGQAFVPVGYAGGGLIVDLNDPTQVTKTVDLNGDDVDDNIFSVTTGPDGDFYAVWSDSGWGANAVHTRVYRYNVSGPTHTAEVVLPEAAPGDNSGAVAFDADGNMVVSSSYGIVEEGVYYGYARIQEVILSEGSDPTLLPWIDQRLNGTSPMIFDEQGNLFIGATTGIGVVWAGSNTVEVYYGDPFHPDPFFNPPREIKGMALDPVTGKLLIAERVSGAPGYSLALIPEPASALLLSLGLPLVLRRRGRGR
jgi:hypothetical protein